jgi:hypothetical protein
LRFVFCFASAIQFLNIIYWRRQITDNEVKGRNLAVIGMSNLRSDGYGYFLELIKIIINEMSQVARTNCTTTSTK